MFPFGVLPAGNSGVDIGDPIANSIMLDSSASQYLSRTFGTPTSATTYTVSTWIKRGKLGVSQAIFDGAANGYTYLTFAANDTIFFAFNNVVVLTSVSVFRDPSAWMHIQLKVDTTQAVAANRLSLYVNGALQSVTGTPPAQNTADSYWNVAGAGHQLFKYYTGNYADYYSAIAIFIDGQALPPSAFGRVSIDTGQWVNKDYTGTYGANGFKLDFSNGAALGTDTSGNGNNWTLNGGITSANQYTDTPTNNFSVWNSLSKVTTAPLSVGNTKMSASAIAIGPLGMFGTMKPYWEISSTTAATSAGMYGTAATTTTSIAAGKTYGFRFDAGAGTLDYINITDAGSWTSLATGLSAIPYFQYASTAASATAILNSGGRSFVGTVPAGYAGHCTANMQEGTAAAPATFNGNVSADGPHIFCNGTPETLSLNGNAATWGTHADKTAGGFKLRTASASYNAAGSNTISATFLTPNRKSVFKYQTAKGNP